MTRLRQSRQPKNRKIDTSAPMEIGMAAEDDGESLIEEGDQRNVDLALQAVYKGTSRLKWSFGMGQSWNEKRYQSGKGGKGGRKEPMTEG